MQFQSGMTGMMALNLGLICAFAGWLIVSRAPAILHAPLTSGCAFLNSMIALAGLHILLNAGTLSEQIAGFCALLFGTASAAGGYAVAANALSIFGAKADPILPASAAATKRAAATQAAKKRGRSPRRAAKPRLTKKT